MAQIASSSASKQNFSPHDYLARVENTRNSRSANCISTALYLSGLLREDFPVIDTWDAAYYLRALSKAEPVRPGCLLAWQSSKELTECTEVPHMGIVVSLQPFLITHRKGIGFLLEEAVSPGEMIKKYDQYEMQAYLPILTGSFPRGLVCSLRFNE